jgi:hypothetical protein
VTSVRRRDALGRKSAARQLYVGPNESCLARVVTNSYGERRCRGDAHKLIVETTSDANSSRSLSDRHGLRGRLLRVRDERDPDGERHGHERVPGGALP